MPLTRDVSIQAGIPELLARLKEKTGISILIVSHDLGVVRGGRSRASLGGTERQRRRHCRIPPSSLGARFPPPRRIAAPVECNGMSNMKELKLYIDGRYTDAMSGETFETINPATGKVICTVQVAGRADVDRAVQSAKGGGSRMVVDDRGPARPRSDERGQAPARA